MRPGEDPRVGRWSGFEKIECGLHVVVRPQIVRGIKCDKELAGACNREV
jgi:hypothetical protein